MQDIKEIEAALDEFGDWWEISDCTETEIEGIDGIVTGIEHEGGGKGQGEYTHIVLKIVHDGVTRHFKKVGCHVSHDGTSWDGPFTEVQQKQKVIQVWE